MNSRFVVACCMVILCITSLVNAAIPHLISYQGVLTDAGGATVPDGEYPMTFAIFAAELGGQALWSVNRPVNTANGVFDILLGENLPLNLPFDEPYWLETVYEGQPMSPRTLLAASAYSLRAADVEDEVAVRSINGLQDNVTISSGPGTTVDIFGDTLRISSVGTRIGSDVSGATTDLVAEWTSYGECAATVHVTGPGMVVCESVVQLQVSYTTGTIDRIQLCHSLDLNSAGPAVAYYSVYSVPAEYPTFANNEVTVPVQTVFEVQGPDDLTFYLNGRSTQGVGGDRFWYASLTATFYPQDEIDTAPALDGRPPHFEKPSR